MQYIVLLIVTNNKKESGSCAVVSNGIYTCSFLHTTFLLTIVFLCCYFLSNNLQLPFFTDKPLFFCIWVKLATDKTKRKTINKCSAWTYRKKKKSTIVGTDIWRQSMPTTPAQGSLAKGRLHSAVSTCLLAYSGRLLRNKISDRTKVCGRWWGTISQTGAFSAARYHSFPAATHSSAVVGTPANVPTTENERTISRTCAEHISSREEEH